MSPAPATVARPAGLPGYAVFAGLLAMAGLPLYIHAPKFYVDTYGVSLAALGLVLGGLRFLDFVQDPLLGWLAARTRAARGLAVALAAAVMALAMLGLIHWQALRLWWKGATFHSRADPPAHEVSR